MLSFGYFENETVTTLPLVLQVEPPLDEVPPLELAEPLLDVVPPELLVVPPLLDVVPPELLVVPPLLLVAPLELAEPLLLPLELVVPPLLLVSPPLLLDSPLLDAEPELPPPELVFELPVVGDVGFVSVPPYGPPSGVTFELQAGYAAAAPTSTRSRRRPTTLSSVDMGGPFLRRWCGLPRRRSRRVVTGIPP